MITKARIYAVVGLLLGLVVVAAGLPLQAQTPKRNLLLITADDLNGDSMGWMGSKVGATPNIDAFAATCQIARLRRQLLAHMQKTGDPQLAAFKKIAQP
jgi:hypothetical protein